MPRDPSARGATRDLFEVPAPPDPTPGSMHHSVEVAELVGQALKAADGDRYDVSARMSRLVGRTVSTYMLDAWSSPARTAYNLPLYLTPALEAACDTHLLTRWLAERRGARLLIGRESLDAELGRLERQREEAARRIKQLKQLMGGER